MKNTPITITLYDENDEVKGEYQRLIIPWNMLKRALKFRELDTENLEETFDELAGFVCELFGNRFTAEKLGEGCDIAEIFAVIQAVVARAGGYFGPNSQAGT